MSVGPESPGEKLTKAQELKLEGNQFFKAGQLREAMRKYHYGLLYVRGVTNRVDGLPGVEQLSKAKPSPAEEQAARDLTATLSNNLAGVFLCVTLITIIQCLFLASIFTLRVLLVQQFMHIIYNYQALENCYKVAL